MSFQMMPFGHQMMCICYLNTIDAWINYKDLYNNNNNISNDSNIKDKNKFQKFIIFFSTFL